MLCAALSVWMDNIHGKDIEIGGLPIKNQTLW
jgi:hypothetical protein